MGFKQHISRTWQMIEQQVNDVPFRPDNEAGGEVKAVVFKGLREIGKRFYPNFTHFNKLKTDYMTEITPLLYLQRWG